MCLLLGGVAAGCEVVVAASVEELAGCQVAFVDAASAEAALDAGVDDVLACSLTPFATRLAAVPPMVLDAAAEVPSYGDAFSGRPWGVRVVVGRSPLAVTPLEVGPHDRVLVEGPLVDALPGALGALSRGAAVVLLRDGEVPASEGVTVRLPRG